MEFGWINLFGAAIVIIMLLPNILYAVKNKNMENKCKNKLMNLIEQIGRYGCIVLMWLPLIVWKFGFSSVNFFLIYLITNLVLILLYLFMWLLYFKNCSPRKAMALAVMPTCIFLLSGLLLQHWLLVFFAILFGMGHIYVTKENNR